jgi:hypothetical protein
MEFGEVLSRAWHIIWKYKVLWIFGILAGCGTASGGASSNSGFRYSSNNRIPPVVTNFFQRANEGLILTIIGIIIVVVVLLFIVSIILGTIGRVGLIRGTQLGDKNAEHIAFSELFNESLRYFWRVLGLNLLVGIVLFIIYSILVLAYIVIGVATLFVGFICLLPFVCLLVPLGWFVQVVLEQANVALVVEDTGIMDAIQRGWMVVKTNIGPIILMALILIIGVSLIGGGIIALPIGAIILPILGGAIIGGQTAVNTGLLIAGLCFVAYLPVLLILSGILRAYTSTAWTLTYLRLTRPATRPAPPIPAAPIPPPSASMPTVISAPPAPPAPQEPVEPPESIEPPKPAESQEPIEPAEPAEPIEPAEPVEPQEPSEPPAAPTE